MYPLERETDKAGHGAASGEGFFPRFADLVGGEGKRIRESSVMKSGTIFLFPLSLSRTLCLTLSALRVARAIKRREGGARRRRLGVSWS